MPPDEGQVIEPQPKTLEEIAAPLADGEILDTSAIPAAGTAEPAPVVTLEEVQAERDRIAAELEAANTERESLRRESSSKDKALQRTREERDRIVSDLAGARSKAERDQWGQKLREASDDPEKADSLIKELRDSFERPPSVDTDAIATNARMEWGQQTHAEHRVRLSITDEEENEAFAIAKDWAKDDGREQVSLQEIMAAESEVAARRRVNATTAELTAAQERVRLAEEERDALAAGGAGARMRAAGGPEDRVPNGGGAKRYRTMAELNAALATRQITPDEFRAAKKEFEPVARRI